MISGKKKVIKYQALPELMPINEKFELYHLDTDIPEEYDLFESNNPEHSLLANFLEQAIRETITNGYHKR
jgi:hypothetical protein